MKESPCRTKVAHDAVGIYKNHYSRHTGFSVRPVFAE